MGAGACDQFSEAETAVCPQYPCTPFLYKGLFSWAHGHCRVEDCISQPPLQLVVAMETSSSLWVLSSRTLCYFQVIPLEGGAVFSSSSVYPSYWLNCSCVESQLEVKSKIPAWWSSETGSPWVLDTWSCHTWPGLLMWWKGSTSIMFKPLFGGLHDCWNISWLIHLTPGLPRKVFWRISGEGFLLNRKTYKKGKPLASIVDSIKTRIMMKNMMSVLLPSLHLC